MAISDVLENGLMKPRRSIDLQNSSGVGLYQTLQQNQVPKMVKTEIISRSKYERQPQVGTVLEKILISVSRDGTITRTPLEAEAETPSQAALGTVRKGSVQYYADQQTHIEPNKQYLSDGYGTVRYEDTHAMYPVQPISEAFGNSVGQQYYDTSKNVVKLQDQQTHMGFSKEYVTDGYATVRRNYQDTHSKFPQQPTSEVSRNSVSQHASRLCHTFTGPATVLRSLPDSGLWSSVPVSTPVRMNGVASSNIVVERISDAEVHIGSSSAPVPYQKQKVCDVDAWLSTSSNLKEAETCKHSNMSRRTQLEPTYSHINQASSGPYLGASVSTASNYLLSTLATPRGSSSIYPTWPFTTSNRTVGTTSIRDYQSYSAIETKQPRYVGVTREIC